MGRCGILGRQTVFHQPDVHAAGPHSDRLGVVIGRVGLVNCVAQSHRVHAVDGNLVFGYEIALDRFGQPLGTLDADAARAG